MNCGVFIFLAGICLCFASERSEEKMKLYKSQYRKPVSYYEPKDEIHRYDYENGRRQKEVNERAARLGYGVGTAREDGVPGTPLDRHHVVKAQDIFDHGFQVGLKQGFSSGFNTGFHQGHGNGYGKGFNRGYTYAADDDKKPSQ